MLAGLVGADADEIIFTSGATEANNLALLGMAQKLGLQQRRKRILVSAIEHKCVMAAASALSEHQGFVVQTIPVDSYGYVRSDELKRLISDDVLLCSVILANNEIGTLQNLAKIREICERFGVLLHSDAAQGPVAMDLSNIADHADMVSLSGHKMYGPMGIGALYVRRNLHPYIEPIIYGGGQQGNLRSGTLPLPLCVGMSAAAQLWLGEGVINARAKLCALRDCFAEKVMRELPETKLNGPPLKERHSCNINFCFHDVDSHELLSRLQPHLSASTGSACSSGISGTSHVLRAIGLSESDASASVRFSVGMLTTEQQIDSAVALLLDALNRSRSALSAAAC